MIIKSKHSGYSHDGVRRACFSTGGGGGGGTSQSYTTNIPEYAKKPYMDLVGKASALSNAPYQPYTGERQAQFTPLQQQAFEGAQNLQTAPQTAMGTGMAAMGAGRSFVNQGNAQSYMSPYMQNVVDVQQREAVRQNQIADQGQAAKAVGAGAFGGSREALMRAESARNLGTQLGDIQARGLQSAYDQAQQQFNAEQNRMLQGAQVMGGLGQQQFGQQKDILGMQSQFGGQQQQAVQQMLDRGYADYQTAQNYPYQQLGFMSDILRGTQGTTRAMYEPAASPMQQLVGAGTAMYGASKLFADGGPVENEYTQGGVFQGQGQGQEPQVGMPQNFAKGGKISSGQGIEALANKMQYLPPSTLEQKAAAAQNNDLKGFLAAKIAEQQQQQIRAGAQNQQALNAPPPQGTVVQNELANSGIAAAAPQSAGKFADGGIVSFADGGETVNPFHISQLWPSIQSSFLRAQQESELAAARQRQAMGRATPADTELLTKSGASQEAENANELQRMRNRAEAVKATPASAPSVTQKDRTVPNPYATSGAPSAAPTGAAQPKAPSAAPAGLASLSKLDPMATEREMYKGYTSDLEKARDAQRKAAEGTLSEYDAEMAKLGKLGEEREAGLKSREKELEGRKEEIKGNALMQAGLAILSADPKRGLAAAIGTGGQAGLAAYEKDAEKLQAAKEKIQDGLYSIQDLRRQEQMATGKERRGLKSEIDKANVDFAKSVAEASGARYKVTSEMGAKLYDSMLDYQAKMAAVQATREGHQLMAGARGASGDAKTAALYDKAVDNAQKRIEGMTKENPNLRFDSAKVEALRAQYVREEMANMGLKPPATQAGAGVTGLPSDVAAILTKYGK